MFDNKEFDKHAAHKSHNLRRHKLARQFKTKDAIKHASYQKACDQYKRRLKSKSIGLEKKIKGQTLRTGIACNDQTTKSWQKVGYGASKPLKEGFKHYTIYAIT